MLLCVACYGDRLASLLDTATDLRLFEVQGGEVLERGRLPQPLSALSLPADLSRAGVRALLCGAVTGRLLHALERAGLDVRPWLRGGPREVLAAWRAGELERYRMPGCGPGVCDGTHRRTCCRKRGNKE
jgi:predicted Fe-Mo cluster-binding NifX family protein